MPQNITAVSHLMIGELVSLFIASHDVKLSSILLYRRTLKRYFAWIYNKNYLLHEIVRPQLSEYKDELLLSRMSSLTVGSYIR
jgi:hypothetical protein